uniref:NADH dehydrogenase subunit 6 n=1 Tax=Carios capensis TaxID=176285 RepID=A0A1P8AG99_CARC1|nr:NADH dehydrogenase subunit 6 [Alectorobius capensis]AMX74143.1 NADH dehydrogenase subunit 6 [Alectorobius capensis]
MKLIFMMTSLFMCSSHPIMLIMIMITTTLMMNMYMYMYMKHLWFIFMITLLILGGLLVIFLYITSLTPNKKFSLKSIFFISIPMSMIFNFPNMSFPNTFKISLLFSPLPSMMLMFILIYLMLTLLSITTLIKSSMAPLKSMN